jgi:hypothetical protein
VVVSAVVGVGVDEKNFVGIDERAVAMIDVVVLVVLGLVLLAVGFAIVAISCFGSCCW